jgi:hypothetical protein
MIFIEGFFLGVLGWFIGSIIVALFERPPPFRIKLDDDEDDAGFGYPDHFPDPIPLKPKRRWW